MFTGLRILAVTPAPTHPTTAGNRARFHALLDRLQRLGATIRLVHVNHEAGDLDAMREKWQGGVVQLPFALPVPRHARWNTFARRIRRYLGLSIADRTDVDDWYDPSTLVAFRAEVRAFRPHAVVMLYFWNSALLDDLPAGTLSVLDAQDVFTERNERMARAGLPQRWFSVSQSEEARGLDRFDVVLAIQEHEAVFYRSISRTPVVAVGHFLQVVDAGPPALSPCVLILGSDNSLNVDGVRWFIAEVWPIVLEAMPNATLELVGRVCEHIAPAQGVYPRGVVANLRDVYAAAALVVNPLRGGTGLKIKSAEALGAGRVVVSTPSAAEGLERAIGRGLVVSETAKAMAMDIVALLGDRERLARDSEAAQGFALEWNDSNVAAFDRVFEQMMEAVRGE